jgi:hypothetical protein
MNLLLSEGHGRFGRVDDDRLPFCFTSYRSECEHKGVSLGYG